MNNCDKEVETLLVWKELLPYYCMPVHILYMLKRCQQCWISLLQGDNVHNNKQGVADSLLFFCKIREKGNMDDAVLIDKQIGR